MSAYAAAANAIFDPQLESEKVGVTRQKEAGLATLDQEQQKIDPLYAKVVDNLFRVRNEEGARQDFTYSNALSGQSSGLLGNQQRLIGEELGRNVTQTESERMAAHQKIATSRKLYNDDYNAGISALVQKYAGLKNQHISNLQQIDADRAFTASENAKSRAGQMAAAAASRAPAPPTPERASRDEYNNELADLDNTLRNFQKAGYKGDLGAFANRGAIKNKLTNYYKGTVSAKEINGYIDALYGRYHIG